MNIVYYTGGTLGSGRLVIGMSIGNALARKGIKCKYTIVHNSKVPQIASDYNNIKIPFENEWELTPSNYQKSVLFKTLRKLKPDILLINHQWFTVFHFIDEMKCKKLYLADYTYDSHYSVSLEDRELNFQASQYNKILAIEPYKSSIEMEKINPIIIRNRDEILDKDTALTRLNLEGTSKNALFSFGYQPDHYEQLCGKYSYLENDYSIFRLALYKDDLTPIVDYYNAFDLIACAGGYNNVWEVNYFQKKSIIEPLFMNFSDQSIRIKASREFQFDNNGADQLVKIIMSLQKFR